MQLGRQFAEKEDNFKRIVANRTFRDVEIQFVEEQVRFVIFSLQKTLKNIEEKYVPNYFFGNILETKRALRYLLVAKRSYFLVPFQIQIF